jgi:hypothetical protein
MKLKLDANGNAVLQDGKPVYVHDDGKEVAFDAPATVQTISRLNGEAKTHRERAEAAEAKLKPFEGIEDPAAARKALETVKNLDSKKLVDAGEVEKVKEEATKALKAQYEPIVTERDKLKADLYAEKIGGSFSRSKAIADKFAIPADLVQARFGNAFTIEDGKIVAKDQAGNKIYSRARPGELADFDEALEVLVDQYPYKDSILKGSGASGSGAGQGKQGAGGQKTMTRAQFEALDATARAAAVKDTTITD